MFLQALQLLPASQKDWSVHNGSFQIMQICREKFKPLGFTNTYIINKTPTSGGYQGCPAVHNSKYLRVLYQVFQVNLEEIL